jgi:hypothetical protein
VCAAAADAARQAAVEAAGQSAVGDHLAVYAEGERLVAHHFAAAEPGYRGWRWSVTVARAPRARHVTVCEVVLLPGPEAVLAPEWVPWSERLRPGDLGVGDLLPTPPDDDRLVPAYLLTDDTSPLDDVDAEAAAATPAEVGLGRVRVMGRLGREETAERWYGSDSGPDAAIAKAAPARCGTCGFYLPLAGSLNALFGACGNLFAPDDGRVVSADHGCGAHSEALVEPAPVGATDAPVDDSVIEVVRTAHAPGSVGDTEPGEELGHS